MTSRAMIVVAGGTSSRFGGEKLMATISGRPLIAHSIEAVSSNTDITVVATRADLVEEIKELGLGVVVTIGGQTRTDSELAGLTALGREYELIGIHDGARPLVKPDLIELLYAKALEVGGAVPTLEPAHMLIDKKSLTMVENAHTVQTPQVFQGPGLLAAYVKAAQTSFAGHDTVDVVQRFGDLEIAAVPGDASNIKVTYPEDLEAVRTALEG
jgi:2-C-methyl-D-erythritol 4-phosphate cytidylyltransferase